MTEIEEVKAQIKVLEKKLSFLEELEKTKTPVEEAFKDWMGVYPPTNPSVDNIFDIRWRAFQKGYDAAYQEPEENEWKSVALRFGEELVSIGPCGYYEFTAEEWFDWVVNTYEKICDDTVKLLKKENLKKHKNEEKAQERGERIHKEVERCVRESVKWCEENPDKDPLDWVKPQTPEQVADGLKEAFREAVKQGVVSSTKPPTLTDLIYDWWERVFGDTDDTETCIENLVDEISLWLPTEHETNSYKWNECIRMIREKLR